MSSIELTPEFLKELEAIDYPLPSDNVKVLVDKIRNLEKEADWLANRCEQLATVIQYEAGPYDGGQSARYWREAARRAVEEEKP